MYVLVGEVPPPMLPATNVLVDVMPHPCVARWVCAGWRGATPLQGHSLVLPAMYLLVGLLPFPCVARQACAGWCVATTLCCPLSVCWLM